MSKYEVRQAALDDTMAICKLARSRVSAWQRLDSDGKVHDLPYETLSVYERWMHGGPWMSVETGAIQLNHLLRGAGIPLVVIADAQIVAYAEVFSGVEPDPYGKHLHITSLTVYQEYLGGGADDALLDWLVNYARKTQHKRITANCAVNDIHAREFYERHGMSVLEEISRMNLPVKAGQVFYKAVEHLNANPAQIEGWYLSIGRLGSARQQWEALWHQRWDSIAEIKNRKTHRLSFNAAGNEAFVMIRQQLYIPRNADVYCWTSKPPTGQLITAIRDWAQQEGYRKLVIPIVSSGIKILGLDAEPDGYEESVYAVKV